MQKTSLISGGAGFIGSHLADKLILSGHNVIAADNLLTGKFENISYLQNNPNFDFLKWDITKPPPQTLPQKLDYIYHLASLASPNPKSEISYLNFPFETIDVNTTGTKNLLELAQSHNSKFLFASTSEVYGNPKVHPQTEDYFGNVNPFSPRSCYDESKRLGETIVNIFVKKFGVDGRVVRIFNTYGSRMNPKDERAIVNFIHQALKNKPITIYGDGSYTRSFCYISDLVGGLVKTMETVGTEGKVFNLGNPDERTILEAAKLIKRLTGSKSQIVFEEVIEGDVERRCPDITKAKEVLGWQPVVSFEEGLKKMIEFYRSQI